MIQIDAIKSFSKYRGSNFVLVDLGLGWFTAAYAHASTYARDTGYYSKCDAYLVLSNWTGNIHFLLHTFAAESSLL